MRFYVLKHDYEGSLKKEETDSFKLYEGTSVLRHEKWFFNCIRQHGRIIPLDRRLRERDLRSFLSKPDAIFVSVHSSFNELGYDRIPRRMLSLSLGTLLVSPESLYRTKELPSAQVLLVSTKFQIERLESLFGNLMPRMYVFPHKVDVDFFVPPDRKQKALARRKYGIKEGQVHIVYAGRWVVTKGICQLIRILDIWPLPNIVLTLAGNIEEDNRIAYSFAHHKTFPNFLDNEIFQKKRNWLRLQPASYREDLRELFWSADLFVNPSIQPDEDFGVTPREAISCGLPILATNFGGLYPLTENMPWKGVDTYPTLMGSRFSLRQLHNILYTAVKNHRLFSPQEYRKVIDEYGPEIAKKNLRAAIDYLKDRHPERPVDIEVVKRKVKRQLYNIADERAFRLFINSRKKLPAGSYIYGDGPTHYTLPIVQGIYSAKTTPPIVERDTKWRGFFRIAMWEKERALVEFGFPGPRIKHYPEKLWNSLKRCCRLTESGDYIITPLDRLGISLVQELVDLGYLVSDD